MTLLSNGTLLDRLSGTERVERLGGLIRYRRRLPSWQQLQVTPLAPGAVQPCSIDVHLGDSLLIYEGPHMDTRRDNSPWWRPLSPADHVRTASGALVSVHTPDSVTAPDSPPAWVLQPNRFYLAVLKEYIVVPEDCCAQLGGVSSEARNGVMIHQQAGLLDPGWDGCATLEITVASNHTILYAGQRIGQITLTRLDRRARPSYRGRYQHDTEPQPARLYRGAAA